MEGGRTKGLVLADMVGAEVGIDDVSGDDRACELNIDGPRTEAADDSGNELKIEFTGI